ncbi:MAG: hypothetical protein AD742_08730 [Methylibium sp. NZG]|nr:MAG: hypothetical protein AD742_08730 [Methylibium sp. NZG]
MKVVFVDTGFWIARFNPNDTQSKPAAAAATALGQVRLLTTEMVLSEFLAAFAKPPLRASAVQAVRAITANPNVEVVAQTSLQFREALDLFASRADKEWSLTDCASFNLMRERGVTEALAHDHHFEQAGFFALLRAAPT